MSGESEGSAADFARLLTGVQSEPSQLIPSGKKPSSPSRVLSTEPQPEAGLDETDQPDRAHANTEAADPAEEVRRTRLHEAGLLNATTKAERDRALVELLHPPTKRAES